jgi:hypothetical protein
MKPFTLRREMGDVTVRPSACPGGFCPDRCGTLAPSRRKAKKGAVSTDGPETPERVQLNKATIGFPRHGGNGYEGIAFLLRQFCDSGLFDPGDAAHGLDLKALARSAAADYRCRFIA